MSKTQRAVIPNHGVTMESLGLVHDPARIIGKYYDAVKAMPLPYGDHPLIPLVPVIETGVAICQQVDLAPKLGLSEFETRARATELGGAILFAPIDFDI